MKPSNFISIILVVIFVFHVGFIINNIINPEIPEISISKKNLQEIEFPLSFLICINQHNNDSAKYKEVGYKSVYRFYKGESIFNNSIFGWRGHKINGSKYDTVEGHSIVFQISINKLKARSLGQEVIRSTTCILRAVKLW